MHTAWIIFSFSFVVALTGAMAPGPLLTYTIVRTMQSRSRGFLVGVFVIAGHALIESVLIVALLLGASTLLKSPLAGKIIGTVGGLFLLLMGGSLVWNVWRGRVSNVFGGEEDPESGERSGEHSSGRSGATAAALPRPFWGGVLISMSNPYWWIWWASIGFAFMLKYRISLFNWSGLAAFVLGHEAGDLLWYGLVSTLVFLGRRRISMGLYKALLVICGVFMAGFGLYLGIGPLAGQGL